MQDSIEINHQTKIKTRVATPEGTSSLNSNNNNLAKVINFGCRLNLAESTAMLEQINNSGLRNVIIINGCSVTAKSEQKVQRKIRSLKKTHPNYKIILTGCPATINREKYESMPELDQIFSNQHKEGIVAKLALQQKHSQVERLAPFSTMAPLKPTTRAFVPIQNGCDHDCTFCIIPSARGFSRSVCQAEVLEKVEKYLACGSEEIVLTGVDLTSWGRDFKDKDLFLGDLIETILMQFDHDDRLKRLRISSLDCIEVDDKLISLWSRYEKLMPHVHLSLQSGSNLILKRMKRRHLAKDAEDIISRLRTARKDIIFGADIIAGFPTEKDHHFQETVDFLKNNNITWLHVFAYSQRKNTKAALMPQVDSKVIHKRAKILREFAKQQQNEFLASKLGQDIEILLEENLFGYSCQYAKVKLSDNSFWSKSMADNSSKVISGKVIGADLEKGHLIMDLL